MINLEDYRGVVQLAGAVLSNLDAAVLQRQ
jgi:hypothetical protein